MSASSADEYISDTIDSNGSDSSLGARSTLIAR